MGQQHEMFPPQPPQERSEYLYLKKFIDAYKKQPHLQMKLLAACKAMLRKSMENLRITVYSYDNIVLSLFGDDVVVVEKGKK